MYSGPIRLKASAQLTARVFCKGYGPSGVSVASFSIDPGAILLDEPGWAIFDTPAAGASVSDWQMVGGTAVQWSNLCAGPVPSTDPAQERPGTLRYRSDLVMGDGELSLELCSDDDDGIGVAFRLQDPEHYYLWGDGPAAGGFHVLARKAGAGYEALRRRSGDMRLGSGIGCGLE